MRAFHSLFVFYSLKSRKPYKEEILFSFFVAFIKHEKHIEKCAHTHTAHSHNEIVNRKIANQIGKEMLKKNAKAMLKPIILLEMNENVSANKKRAAKPKII